MSPPPLTHNPEVAAAIAKEGLRLLQTNKMPKAMEKFREAIDLDPDNHDAHGNMGIALVCTGKRAEAEPRRAGRLRLLAGQWPHVRQPGPGPTRTAQVRTRGADASPRRRARAEAYRHAPTGGHHPRGQEAGRRSGGVLSHGDCPEPRRRGRTIFGWAGLLMRTNRHADAEACFGQTTRLQPDKATHWIDLGAARGSRNRAKAAETAFRVAVKLDPANAEAHNSLGISLMAQNRWAEADPCFRKAIELNPNLLTAHNNLGNNLRSLQRLDEAEACLREAVRLQPQYAEAHNNLGIVLVQQCRIAEGMASYEEALRLRPDYAEARLNRSFLLLALGDFERAWTEYSGDSRCGRGLKPVFRRGGTDF